jgi:hypothetical protein
LAFLLEATGKERTLGELLFEKKFVGTRILTIFASPKQMGQSSKRNGLLRS